MKKNKQNIEIKNQSFDKSYYKSKLKDDKILIAILIGFIIGQIISWFILCILAWNDLFLFLEMSAITIVSFIAPLLLALFSHQSTKRKINNFDKTIVI